MSNAGNRLAPIDFGTLLAGASRARLRCISRPGLQDKRDNAMAPEQNQLARHVATTLVHGVRAVLPAYSFCVVDL